MEVCIGKNIKYLREQKNINQQTFAEIINVPRSTLACWETGLRTPKLEQIVKIANYFNTNLDIIYTDYQHNNNHLNNNLEAEITFLQNILKERGIINDNDQITKESYNQILSFIAANKSFLIDNPKNNS